MLMCVLIGVYWYRILSWLASARRKSAGDGAGKQEEGRTTTPHATDQCRKKGKPIKTLKVIKNGKGRKKEGEESFLGSERAFSSVSFCKQKRRKTQTIQNSTFWIQPLDWTLNIEHCFTTYSILQYWTLNKINQYSSESEHQLNVWNRVDNNNIIQQ